MDNDLRNIIANTSREELEDYLIELAENNRNIKMEMLERFSTDDCKVGNNTFIQMVEDLEDDYDMGKKWLSSKGSAGFSSRLIKILENTGNILLEQDEPNDLISFLLWMTVEADSFTMQPWDRNTLDPLSEIAETIREYLAKAFAYLSFDEKENKAKVIYDFLQDSDLHEEYLCYLPLEFIYRNTNDEEILYGLLTLLNKWKETDFANPRVNYICENVTHRYRIFKILGFDTPKCLANLADELNYVHTTDTIAKLLMQDKEWRYAYDLLFILYNQDNGKCNIPYDVDDNIYKVAINAGMEKHLGQVMLNKCKKESYLLKDKVVKLEKLLGRETFLEELPELLKTKSSQYRLTYLKEYGLMDAFYEAFMETGLIEDLVEYHDDLKELGIDKLKAAYRNATIKSIDVKKSRENYYDVLHSLYNLPLIKDEKDYRLRDGILYELQELYPKRKALLEAIYYTIRYPNDDMF